MYKIITKNCTVRKLILLGVKVYFNDKWGGLVFLLLNHSGVNFISRISNYGGVEVKHLRVIAQLFLSSEVFLNFPLQLRLCKKWLFSMWRTQKRAILLIQYLQHDAKVILLLNKTIFCICFKSIQSSALFINSICFQFYSILSI